MKLNTQDLITVKTALEELYTNGIDAIRSIELDENDRIVGVFREGAKLYKFALDPDGETPEEQISYVPLNPEVVNKQDSEIDWQWLLKNDAYTFVTPFELRQDKKNCKEQACGNSCISMKKTCRSKEELTDKSKKGLKEVQSKLSLESSGNKTSSSTAKKKSSSPKKSKGVGKAEEAAVKGKAKAKSEAKVKEEAKPKEESKPKPTIPKDTKIIFQNDSRRVYSTLVGEDDINFVAIKLPDGSFNVSFDVNESYDRAKSMTPRQGVAISTRIRDIMKYDVSTQEEGTIYTTSAWTNDGLGDARARVYEKFGFSAPEGNGSKKQRGIVQNGKLVPYTKKQS